MSSPTAVGEGAVGAAGGGGGASGSLKEHRQTKQAAAAALVAPEKRCVITPLRKFQRRYDIDAIYLMTV